MAVPIPDLEAAKVAKQKPTAGEIFLLEFMRDHFDDQVEVYSQPCFNGDRPDIILMSPTMGAIIIEFKDCDLDLYSIEKIKSGPPAYPTDCKKLSRRSSIGKRPIDVEATDA